MPDPDETQSFDPLSDETSEQTVAFTPPDEPPGPPPPTATQPMYSIPPPGGGGGRYTALIMVLTLLAGLGVGFAAGHFIGRPNDKVPGENLVFFEPASMEFPIAGAAFTRTTYDERRGKCDKTLLKQYLRADERRFKAWIELQGITENDFDSFVDRLETRVLASPTPFTNHGCYPDGQGPCPFAIQSVLDTGTPVWWDPGQQRVVAKCRCSNPLKEPKCPPNCGEQPTPTPTATPPPQTQPPTTAPPTTAPPTEPPVTLPPTFPPTTPPSFTEQPSPTQPAIP